MSYPADEFVGMYVLGNIANGGYARFTTSPSVATWASGPAAPPTGTTCAQGSLYSCAGTATSCKQPGQSQAFALWGCPIGSGDTWQGIDWL